MQEGMADIYRSQEQPSTINSYKIKFESPMRPQLRLEKLKPCEVLDLSRSSKHNYNRRGGMDKFNHYMYFDSEFTDH